ncbi:hypothetical protein SS1G_07778 [Sclerotinia sclerotiorum 1980 UF-70]|uniref:Uncharacterized protein n=1 Tax=Sclerotinia sclerotiorum (strain ATCC 18683 / 1980 / Ss-1) TaxID=665079 RepID=A7ER25_SCLS1|nr:hypothetical protein SS1G_07778 [Sclerotinia sclerotiorum 1980 UF-70]EDN91917.1 hypothetical protein SS1G_07778 [Sclerotinia sclerotiorum 1980 UF-70]
MSFTHPRRTTKTTNEVEGAFNLSSLQRSLSNLESFAVESHKRRAADAIESFELTATGNQSSSTSSRRFRDESEPVPRGVVNVENPSNKSYNTPLMEGIMPSEDSSVRRSTRSRRTTPRYADSGLGSSIGSSSSDKKVFTDDNASKSTKPSTITRSAAGPSTIIKTFPRLSARTTARIQQHILKPLLAKKSFRHLHPLVEDCPRRIHQKEIVSLRDLEKTLIFTAPVSEIYNDVAWGVAHWFSQLKKYTKSASLYLDFCLESIRCIQATVELVNEREQTRPNDRPYTNGYFVDLVEQIKQYAEQVREAKEREEKGETLDEMDAHPSDEVKLHGGLTRNGRPAELVRINKKTGKAVSIATGKPVDMDDDDNKSMRFKRSLSEEAEDEESVMRSMARRKKDASAAELAPKFCPHGEGTRMGVRPDPRVTEKNRPAAPAVVPNGLPSPQATIIHTPGSDSNIESPLIADDEMIYENTSLYTTNHSIDFFPAFPAEMNMFQPPQSLNIEYSPVTDNSFSTDGHSPFDANSPFNSTSVLGAQDQFQENIQAYQSNDEWAAYEQTDLYSAPAQLQIPPNHQIYQEIMGQNTMAFETSGDTYQTEHQQNQHLQPQPMAHISPIGEGNTMLYTPKSMQDFDEGFQDFIPNNTRMTTNGVQDFQLFSAPQQRHNSNPAPLFGEITSQASLGFPGIHPQDLIAFYAQTAVNSAAGTSNHQLQNHYQPHHHRQQQQQLHSNMNMTMDWSSDEYDYGSH